jgi:hypothetical protein
MTYSAWCPSSVIVSVLGLAKYLISARVIGSQLPEKRSEILFPLAAQMELLNQVEELNN